MNERPWLYCTCCAKTRIGKEEPSQGFVPFRDRKSKQYLKGPSGKRCRGTNDVTFANSEGIEPIQRADDNDLDEEFHFDELLGGRGDEDDAVTENMLALLPIVDSEEAKERKEERHIRFPTIDQYREQWRAKKKSHLRGNDDAFSLQNLVPKPIEALMQDVPWVPFHELTSSEAQCRLSAVRPAGNPVQESEFVNGVEHFPSKRGLALPRRHAAEVLHQRVLATHRDEELRSSVRQPPECMHMSDHFLKYVSEV